MSYLLTHARVLIIGGTGSLGKKLIKKFLSLGSSVIVYSRDEAKHWTIRNEERNSNLTFFVGDIRDKNRLIEVITRSRPTHIIVAAALKQVDTCELSPGESVLTNLVGTQNVIDAISATSHLVSVERVLFVSTDKACSPINVYGMCKAVSERLITSQANFNQQTSFIGVRYGNVLESRGSIIPLFKYQAENQVEITVTDPEMTRFVMTLDESVALILRSFQFNRSGQIRIPQLKAMKIGDLAEIFSERYNKPIKIVGLRPGEKLHEDLLNSSELTRCFKQKNIATLSEGAFETYEDYVLEPAYKQPTEEFTNSSYSSCSAVLSKKELNAYLVKLGIFDKALSDFSGRSIEEIVK